MQVCKARVLHDVQSLIGIAFILDGEDDGFQHFEAPFPSGSRLFFVLRTV